MNLEERTITGLHDFIESAVLGRYATAGRRAIDLGAGSGALAARLSRLGCETVAVDLDTKGYKAGVPFVELDLNDPWFSRKLSNQAFDLVTAIEVVEHLESPIAFLRNVGRLLKPDGIALITTPNVDSAAARVKFLLTGKIRLMDEQGEPTHISPVFWDLLVSKYLPRAGLRLAEHLVYPPRGFQVTRRRYVLALRPLGWFARGDSLEGDIHVLLLQSKG